MQNTFQHLISRFSLSPAAIGELWQLTGLGAAPPRFATQIQRFLLTVGFLLLGLGAVFWVAANWQQWGRMNKLFLLEGSLIVSFAVAALAPRIRSAALLLATLLLGATLAFMGQTYQTGADPWQLFAIWALLAVPLMVAAQRDLLWTLWVLIAATAISLWVGARPGQLVHWLFRSYMQTAGDWLLWFGLVAAAFGVQRIGWAGEKPRWTLRLALLIAMVAVTVYGCAALWSYQSLCYLIALGAILSAAYVLWQPTTYDFAALCVVALGLDVLLIASVVRVAVFGQFELGSLLMIGLVAAGIVGGTVSVLLMRFRQMPSLHAISPTGSENQGESK